MKKLIVCWFCLLIISPLTAIVPDFYGARSLALGYATIASNADINALFLNPALLSSMTRAVTGYQFQYNYSDYLNFMDDLQGVLGYDLRNYENLALSQKEELHTRLTDLFNSQKGIHGFRANIPGFAAANYGFSVSLIQRAYLNPQQNELLNRPASELTNEDIASLKMNMVGLNYTRYSFAYSLPLSRTINIGIGLHYFYGKAVRVKKSITDDLFSTGSKTRDYLEYAWDQAEHRFSKIVTDLGATMTFGPFFKIGLVAKNLGSPIITGPDISIKLRTRYIAGLAFTPDPQFGIYFDVDLDKVDVLHNGKMTQPISLGIEKAFFKNQFVVRAGILNDLTQEYFFGSKSNILYGLGLGFNMGRFFMDAAIGINHSGMIDSLAVSGFFIIK